MGFRLLPADNLIGVSNGMLAVLPTNPDDDFYMQVIKRVAYSYNGHVLNR